MIHSPWIRWSFFVAGITMSKSPFNHHFGWNIIFMYFCFYLFQGIWSKSITPQFLERKRPGSPWFPALVYHSGNSRNSHHFPQGLMAPAMGFASEASGASVAWAPESRKQTPGRMFPKNVKNATWPKRCRHRNEKTRKREHRLPLSRFRVLPAAPPRPDTHFVCTGCFRVPNIYAKGRFEFLLFFWLPSFAVLGASFEECFFACFFFVGWGKAKRREK